MYFFLLNYDMMNGNKKNRERTNETIYQRRLYKRVPYGYLELAGKMWFPEDEQISYSNAGDNDALQDDFSLNLSLRKGTADKRWSNIP